MIDTATSETVTFDDIVRFADGSHGRLLSAPLPTDPEAMAEVLLDSGQRLFLPPDALLLLEEGGHSVAAHPSSFEPQSSFQPQASEEDGIVIPLVVETLTVGKREVETGKVRFRTTVTERVETVDVPLIRTEVNLRRVEINEFVDSHPPVRYEGDIMIIPILEEVLVVEKRLRLKEEVYIAQVQTEYHEPQSVTLRHETLLEERLPADDVLD